MSEKNTKKRNTGLAVAVCLLFALVILILFLVKKDQIVTNLKETRFFERIGGTTPEFVQNYVPSNPTEEKIPLPEEVPLTINIETEVVEQKPVQKPAEVVVEKKEPAKVEDKNPPKQEEKKVDNKPVETPKSYIDLQLCFVSIDSDGSLSRKMVKRSVAKNDSPLTTSINLLLAGPNNSKEEKNCMTLIPAGSRLLSARVSNGVAYLNFNEEFEFNGDGVEGQLSQLMQIVYTATTFSTVNSVQFLIDGEKKDYLGSEAVWIGSPLSRNSF